MPYDPLTDEQREIRDLVRTLARERVAPRAAEIDAKAEYPWDLRKLFAEQDLLGLPFPEEYGGTGTGTLMLNVAIEEVARACASSALILMVQELGTLPIALVGGIVIVTVVYAGLSLAFIHVMAGRQPATDDAFVAALGSALFGERAGKRTIGRQEGSSVSIGAMPRQANACRRV